MPKRRARTRSGPRTAKKRPRRARAPVSVDQWIAWVSRRLAGAKLHFGHGTDNALDEAAWLVGHVTGITPGELRLNLNRSLTPAQRRQTLALVQQRARQRKPLAYLINEAWFAGEQFYVDERVIVPRSHLAEFIRERLQPWIAPARVQRVLDLCTGSGCIAVAAARAFPSARVDASDVSPDALAVAAINVDRSELWEQVRLIRSDLFGALANAIYDVILSNPPYVERAALSKLPAEYRHEPTLAFIAGDDGLAIIKRILAEAADHLTPGGVLVVETGNSAEQVRRVYARVPFVWLTTTTGDESVFLLTAEQLAHYRREFLNALD